MLSPSKSQIHTHAFNESDEMFSLCRRVCVYFISHAGEPFLLFVFGAMVLYQQLAVRESRQAGRGL
jgi:hypothetical protein